MNLMSIKIGIYVPDLMDDDNTVIPASRLGKKIEYRDNGKYYIPIFGNPGLSAAEYQDFSPPTLAELRHAFFDKNPDGSFISPEYRESVFSEWGKGEWTSTFVRDRKEAIERPERVISKVSGWIAEGGKVTKVELPPNGWTLEYDKPTGLPSKTSQDRSDAEKLFGDDTSYFTCKPDGLKAVLRIFDVSNEGPFEVCAFFDPSCGTMIYGSRIRGSSSKVGYALQYLSIG